MLQSSAMRLLRCLPVLLPLCVFLFTGWRGLDFGDKHPDEPFQVVEVLDALEKGEWLTDLYNYPSMTYWLTLSATLPDADNLDTAAAQIRADRYPFMLRARHLFLGVTACTILWVYIGVLVMWRRVWLALLAACLIGFSWEVAYHARWIAPDGLLMSFGALTLMFCLCALRYPGRMGYPLLAVIAAGLATGSKYTGGLLLLPTLIAALPYLKTCSWRGRVWTLAGMGFLFAATYLITTPGTLLRWEAFIADVRFEMRHYGEEGHGIHTVEAGIRHLRLNLGYLGQAGLSWFQPVALIFSALALVGVLEARRRPLLTLMLVSFPLAYVLYMSQQRVMFVRNLLVVLPFMAVLAAQGVHFIYARTRSQGRWVGYAVVGGVAALLTLNAYWLFWTADTITRPDDAPIFDDFLAYLHDHPDTVFAVSNPLRDEIIAAEGELPPNAVGSDWENADVAVFYHWEVNQILPANRADTLSGWFGPHEANLNYYPPWPNHYILLLPPDKVVEYFVPIFESNR